MINDNPRFFEKNNKQIFHLLFVITICCILQSSCLRKIEDPPINLVKTTTVFLPGSYCSDITFYNSSNGLIAIDGHSIYKTMDGGHNWYRTITTNSSDDIAGIYWPVKDTVYFSAILTSSGGYHAMYRSVSSGLNWTPVFTLGGNTQLGFCSGRYGYGVAAIPPSSNTQFVKTSNAGVSWQVASGYVPNNFGYNLKFLNEWNGFLISYDNLYKTTNGGMSWTSLGSCRSYTRIDEYGTIFKIDMAGNVFRSIDYGDNWQLVFDQSLRTGEIDYYHDLCCIFSLGTIYISRDRGITWKNYLPDGNLDFSQFYFSGMSIKDQNHILLSGRDATSGSAVLYILTLE